MRVRILGSGVAGLSCALGLIRRAGIGDIQVFEQAPALSQHRMGHGLMLMENGVRALHALQLTHLLSGCTPLRQAIFQNEQGIPIRTETLQDVYCITRTALIEGLRAELPGDILYLNQNCEHIDLTPPPLIRDKDSHLTTAPERHVRTVHFQSGLTLSQDDADLFIGAEGYRSLLCSTLNPGLERPISRVREIVTSTVMPDLAAQLGTRFIKTILADRGAAFGLLAPTSERVIGFLQFDGERYHSPPRNATIADFQHFLQDILASSPEPIPTYLRCADLTTAHVWHPINANLPEILHCDNALLIGDAAHPLLPFTSQGVSAALEDAIVLADLLHSCRENLQSLPGQLAGFCADRRRDLSPYLEQGRRILASFLNPSTTDFVPPYVEGAVSKLAEHLSLPKPSLNNLFRALDANSDGYLDYGEFQQTLQLLEIPLTQEEQQALFAEIDRDGNGQLQLEEILMALGGSGSGSHLLQKTRKRLSPRQIQLTTLQGRLKAFFRLMDRNCSGTIGLSEFMAGLVLLGIVRSVSACQHLFSELDRNQDGAISFEEFYAGMSQQPKSAQLDRFARTLLQRDTEPLSKLNDEDYFADDRVNLSVLRQRAYNYRWAVQEPDVIPFTAADPDFPVAREIIDAVCDYLQSGYLSYGPADGLPEFREVAATRLRQRQGLACCPDQIFVTDSAASALYLVAQFALEQAGDEAIIADPVDFLFERSVLAAGGTVKRLPLQTQPNYSFDPDRLASLITPGKTKLLSICNPHNPLGRVWTVQELEQFAEIALTHQLWILADEVWADIVYPPHVHRSIATLSSEVAQRTFTVLGFSKGYGLAGLRLGLLISPHPRLHRRLVHLAHADETAYGASTLSQIAGMAAYEFAESWLEQFLRHLHAQRDYAVARLNQMPRVTCHTPEGTYVVFPDVSAFGVDPVVMADLLREQYRVAVVPGSPAFFGPGAQGHLRLSFATSRQILTDGLNRLEAGLRQW